MQVDHSKKHKELRAALHDIANGMPPTEAARKHRVNRTTIWRSSKLAEKLRKVDHIIFDRYATESTSDLADELGLTPCQVRNRATELGVSKCPLFIKKQKSEIQKAAAHGFKAGNDPQTKNNMKHKKQRSPIAVFEENASSLRCFGFEALSKLTEKLIKKIYAARIKGVADVKFDFLTVHNGWK